MTPPSPGFDGVLRTEGILLHPCPTTTELVLTLTLARARPLAGQEGLAALRGEGREG